MQTAWNVKSCFLGKSKKSISVCHFLKILPSMLSINHIFYDFFYWKGKNEVINAWKCQKQLTTSVWRRFICKWSYQEFNSLLQPEVMNGDQTSTNWRAPVVYSPGDLAAVLPQDKTFSQPRTKIIFLISPQKHILWVLNRSTSVRHF